MRSRGHPFPSRGDRINFQHAVDTYRGHTIPNFHIVEHRNRWFALSGIVIVLSLAGIDIRALNWSIDFEGGAQLAVHVTKEGDGEVADVTDVLNENGHTNSEVRSPTGTPCRSARRPSRSTGTRRRR